MLEILIFFYCPESIFPTLHTSRCLYLETLPCPFSHVRVTSNKVFTSTNEVHHEDEGSKTKKTKWTSWLLEYHVDGDFCILWDYWVVPAASASKDSIPSTALLTTENEQLLRSVVWWTFPCTMLYNIKTLNHRNGLMINYCFNAYSSDVDYSRHSSTRIIIYSKYNMT